MKKFYLFAVIFMTTLLSKATETVYYDIWVANEQVTSENLNGVTSSDITGNVTFDTVTNTLTLDNATINGNIIINSGSGGDGVVNPVIKLIGTNSIYNAIDLDYGFATEVTGILTIIGPGSLNDCQGIKLAAGIDCLIKDCDVAFETNLKWCSYGYSDNKFTFDNVNASLKSNYIANGNNVPIAIGDFMSIDLIGCKFVVPANAIIDTMAGSGHYVYESDGTTVASEVVISRAYNIEVADVIVTDYNKSAITGENITGTISFDPTTNTLNMDDATIDGMLYINAYANYKDVPHVIINLTGNNEVTDGVSFKIAEDSTDFATITGDGSLNTIEIYCDDSYTDIYVKNTTINVDAVSADYSWGFYGYTGNNFTIENSDVTVEALDYALADFNQLTLIDCEIIYPENAVIITGYDDNCYGQAVCNSDSTYAAKVVIARKSGIAQNEVANISVYPNPVCNSLNVAGEGISNVSLYDMVGQLVFAKEGTGNFTQINMQNLAAGSYFVRVTTNEGTYTEKVIKR